VRIKPSHPQRTLQEVAHVDFDDDRVVGLALHPSEKLCVVTTSGGATHGCSYTDTDLKKVCRPNMHARQKCLTRRIKMRCLDDLSPPHCCK